MADLDPYTMLDLVAEVVRLANPERPERVTQRQFDATAVTDEQYADLPHARNITRLMLQGWGDLVALSLSDSDTRRRALAGRLRAANAAWLTHEQAEYALRLVCRRLGGLATFAPGDYRRERDELIATARRNGAVAEMSLPDEHQVIALFGDWDTALEAVGLQRRDDAPPRRRRTAPTVPEVLERCYEAHGTLPNKGELYVFAQANGIPLPRKLDGKNYADHIAEWQQSRREAGLPFAEKFPRKRDRPDYSVDVGARIDGYERRNNWTPETIIPWLIRFLDELPANVRPVQRAYQDWSRETSGAPSASTVDTHGGFTALMDEARRQRQATRHSKPSATGTAAGLD